MNILMHSKCLTFLSFQFSYVADEESPADFGIADFDDGFQRLENLELSGCNLTGEMPAWLSNQIVLHLNSNKITGPIPSQLGTLPRLFNVDYSSNRIVGEFPKQLLRLPMLSATSYPPAIYLRHKSIYGSIPIEIGQLDSLRRLGLEHNNFTGNIPGQISNLKDLNYLALSENHLSGQIPTSWTSLNFLSFFNVSYLQQIWKGEYQQALRSKALMYLRLKGPRKFVVFHFQMSAIQSRDLMIKIRTMSIKFHRFIFRGLGWGSS
ncbi:putative leucine-rich repeat domain, L domain-containing protein [Rosa chinensis]|uniref:Putative leucine-rich repeat domain, L domain-containing protein n=1 Tax=Rosa chinensis TaxID=74649 RepID=A0A2P6QNN7_ROSCH|nr:putative leucine-rich repeat domain, L domain-containing protein [Rosa chinensis]